MRKVLLAVVMLAVAPVLFAQVHTAGKAEQNISDEQAAIVLQRLEGVQKLAGKMNPYNSSIMMQSVVMLADAFFKYVPQEAGVPANAADFKAKQNVSLRSWALVLDKPVIAGWADGEEFIITKAIDDFLANDAYQWGGEKEKQELAVFSAIIKQYSPWLDNVKQQTKTEIIQQVHKGLGKARPAGETLRKEPMLPLSSHIKK